MTSEFYISTNITNNFSSNNMLDFTYDEVKELISKDGKKQLLSYIVDDRLSKDTKKHLEFMSIYINNYLLLNGETSNSDIRSTRF